MAVKQRQARVVCSKIDFDFLIPAEHHHVFDDAGSIFAGHFCQFKAVTMQMHRMNVVALVAHPQAIFFAFVNGKHRLHFLHREWRAVDCPKIEAVVGGIMFCKSHLDRFIWRLRRRVWQRELSVIPF